MTLCWTDRMDKRRSMLKQLQFHWNALNDVRRCSRIVTARCTVTDATASLWSFMKTWTRNCGKVQNLLISLPANLLVIDFTHWQRAIHSQAIIKCEWFDQQKHQLSVTMSTRSFDLDQNFFSSSSSSSFSKCHTAAANCATVRNDGQDIALKCRPTISFESHEQNDKHFVDDEWCVDPIATMDRHRSGRFRCGDRVIWMRVKFFERKLTNSINRSYELWQNGVKQIGEKWSRWPALFVRRHWSTKCQIRIWIFDGRLSRRIATSKFLVNVRDLPSHFSSVFFFFRFFSCFFVVVVLFAYQLTSAEWMQPFKCSRLI